MCKEDSLSAVHVVMVLLYRHCLQLNNISRKSKQGMRGGRWVGRGGCALHDTMGGVCMRVGGGMHEGRWGRWRYA